MNVERVVAILMDCLGKMDDNNEPLEGCEVVETWLPVAFKAAQAREYEAEMIELLKEWPSESWGQPVPPLGEEINYIVAGAVLGDQRTAFVFFAYGKMLGWWTIMDPTTMLGLDKDEPLAQQMAGSGMIAIHGYKPAETAGV